MGLRFENKGWERFSGGGGGGSAGKTFRQQHISELSIALRTEGAPAATECGSSPRETFRFDLCLKGKHTQIASEPALVHGSQ
jgi:hypothetical protein